MKQALISASMLALFTTMPARADIEAGVKALDDGNIEAAISHFETDLETAETAFDAHWRMGQALVMAGQDKDALDFLEKAVEMNADHADAQYWWGAANGQVAGKASIFSAPGYAKKSLAAFERTLELDPNHMPAREGLVQFHLRAPGIVGGDKDKARTLAAEALEIDRWKGLMLTAMVQQNDKDMEGALETYATMMADFPGKPRPYLDRGLTLREMERFEEAGADFIALAEIGDGLGEDAEKEDRVIASLGHYFLGSVASMSGQYQAEGIKALEAYLAKGNFDHPRREAYARYYLADIYLATGAVDKARENVELAAEKDGGDDLKKLVKKLKKAIKKA
ncbi:MAG: hypothetical protein HWE25_12020 [Alphaproteobacteria bacterium]|nr:hypothetical protein [Alphaproteobacteria bacterium]